MKKYTKKIHKNQKGISLLALTITVLVMSVVTSVLVYNAKDGIAIRNYKNLENDIEILTSKVEAFYLERGELPILKSNGESVLYSGNPNFKRQQQPNDDGAYYVINLNYLGGITLNYGKGFFDIKTIDDTKKNHRCIYNKRAKSPYLLCRRSSNKWRTILHNWRRLKSNITQ